MSTNFENNAISSSGGFKPTTTDTPIDVRCRVETEADILNIPNPYVGMMVYVKDSGKYFVVKTLKSKTIGISTVENAAVDTYKNYMDDIKSKLLDNAIIRIIDSAYFESLSEEEKSAIENDRNIIYIIR